MGLGVLEDTKLEHVPGTVILRSDEVHQEDNTLDPNLKYDRSGKVPILLVPQPSNDPNDPLNWPLLQRDLYLLTLSLLSILASTLSPLLAADTLTVSLYFGRKFTDVALLTGYHLLGVAIAGFLFVPSSRVWGKRHAYLLGTIILVFSSAWAGATHNCGPPVSENEFGGGCAGPKGEGSYKSLLWARIFQGVGLAPFEALVNASVGDMYHVHQRGKRMALTNLALFGGAFFTPVVVGKMSRVLGWWWSFYFVAIFTGVGLPVVVFLVPETGFRRDEGLNIDSCVGKVGDHDGGVGGVLDGGGGRGGGEGQEMSDSIEKSNANEETTTHARNSSTSKLNNQPIPSSSNTSTNIHRKDDQSPTEIDPPNISSNKNNTTALPSISPPPRKTFLQRLKPFDGRKDDEPFINLLLRPFPLFLHPGILWACLIQGTLIGWTVMIGIVLAAIMLGPPLFFTEVETGYMYTGAFIGALIGYGLSGLLADAIPNYLTRLNKGVYEPEFRLPLVGLQLVLGCIGLYGFGVTANDSRKYGWIGPDVFFGFEVAGMVVGAVASALYIVDAHRDIAIEAFTCLMIFKNIFSFALTWDSYNWLVKHGIKPVFMAVASVQVVVCLLTIPMYMLGKKNRSLVKRHNVFFGMSDWVADLVTLRRWRGVKKAKGKGNGKMEGNDKNEADGVELYGGV